MFGVIRIRKEFIFKKKVWKTEWIDLDGKKIFAV
jgi:hypothetical protein